MKVLFNSACVGILIVIVKMHGENNTKYINAQQAKLTHKYHNRGQFFKTIKVLFNSACVGILIVKIIFYSICGRIF